MTRIAVLGAGLTGTCAALELASCGLDVDLFDRLPAPLGGASGANEGKIHLGYTYALDGTLETARMMLRGARVFRPLLERWVGSHLFETATSAPFIYAIPRDSMVTPDDIGRYYARVRKLIADGPPPLSCAASANGASGLHLLSDDERNAVFHPQRIAAAFRSDEVAIEVPALCAALTETLRAMPRLRLRLSSEILAASEHGASIRVAGRGPDGAFVEDYDTVINCLWEQRLKIDETYGLEPPRTAIHRYKAGMRCCDPDVVAGLPNVTFSIGEYGDTTSAGRSAFASWYPCGLLAQYTGLAPHRPIVLDEPRKTEIVEASLENLRALMPGVAACLGGPGQNWEFVGAYITAWGKTGIEDRGSELHRRHDVGVHSHGDYHSIDTGKLTTAPLFAAEACARIRARAGVAA